ncbi:MAG: putative 3-oxoacyl-[acyl-carrier-protein] synthase, partial [Phycisphaerales bacterium]|nr:putative 3-oxoacyl-[acyl-carrier-protein] synthase [Phycisphaerales bacterium]
MFLFCVPRVPAFSPYTSPRMNADPTAPPTSSILITGAGMITCLGLDRATTWEAVKAGRCGVGPLTALEQPAPDGKHGGQAPDLPADESPGDPREVRYLRRAMIDALADAGLDPANLPYPPERCGLVLGTTLHGMRAAGEYLRSGDTAPLSRFLSAAVARSASRGLNLGGFSATTCSACSSSLGAVALGATLLRDGRLDLVLAGGYDPISEYVYAGFNSLRLVAPTPLRPFARDRQGMKLAEGYAVVTLERGADAVRRSARVLATVLGYGESADAHHLTQPHPTGDGAARAIAAALAAAGKVPADVGLIVAHATGTPDNDAGEHAALSRVFGDALPAVPVVGFKSHLGHTLGGAGAVELILAATAMAEQTVPPTANVTPADVEFPGLSVSTGTARPAAVRATLSTSLGFGGANTCVVLGPPPAVPSPPLAASRAANPVLAKPSPVAQPRARAASREVLITGVGVILPGAVGNEAFLSLLSSPPSGPRGDSGPIPDDAIAHLLNARRVRRMSAYVKLMLAAAATTFADAGVTDLPAFGATTAAVLGTAHGGVAFSGDYYRQVVDEGIAAANPILFGEGVPNAAAAHVSLTMSIKGACQTILGSRTAGLDALGLAAMRVAQGDWDRVLVGAGEEYGAIVTDCYRRCLRADGDEAGGGNGGGGLATGCGAVALLLESRDSVE